MRPMSQHTRAPAPALGDWSAQIRVRLRYQVVRQSRGRVDCLGCRRRFANGWSWLHHFERHFGRLKCGPHNLLAVWGYQRDAEGTWEKRP